MVKAFLNFFFYEYSRRYLSSKVDLDIHHGFLPVLFLKGEVSYKCVRCFITGVNDTGDKFTPGVTDTGDKLMTGVNDAGDKF